MVLGLKLIIKFVYSVVLFGLLEAAAVTLNVNDVNKWVNDFGNEIQELGKKTGYVEFNAKYSPEISSTVVGVPEATAFLATLKGKIEQMINEKESSVEKIRIAAENAYQNHTHTNYSCSEFNFFPYYRAAAIEKYNVPPPAASTSNITAPLASAEPAPQENENKWCTNSAYLNLTDDPRLYGVETNRDVSTAHVPPNIHDASNEILNVANWTADLVEVFKSNANSDPTLKWQYMCTTTGMFKIFPGIQWYIQASQYILKDTPIDFFDCRNQYWYLLAASYPKDMVIMVDASGSMKGRRHIIANKTLTELLNTMNNNDFFNVLIFHNDSVKYLDQRFNMTMIQATERHKYMVQEILTKDDEIATANPSATNVQFQPTGMANYEVAFNEAFKILDFVKNNKTTHTSRGTQAIMMITDGAPETYSTVIDKWNKDKKIRIFTYLIGQEASDLDNVKKIACNNNGYFVQISTLADVRENVQMYVPVMARTNVLAKDHFMVWTGVHNNQIMTKDTTTKITNRLFTSVAQAIYDQRNESLSKGEGILLGVAGIDVPVEYFESNAPPWYLGLFAYMFVITNNGYVVMHPEFKPLDASGNLRAFYNNIDIADIEHPVDDIPMFDRPNYSLPLRVNMILRKTGTESMIRIKQLEDFNRGYQKNFRYFYAPLDSKKGQTPFSLGLALPWDEATSKQKPANIQYKQPLKNNSFVNSELSKIISIIDANCPNISVSTTTVTLGEYEFCDFPSSLLLLFDTDPICALRNVLKMTDAEQKAMVCDQIFLGRIYKDAELTESALGLWTPRMNDTVSVKYGVDLLFLFTATGLIRWYNYTKPIDPEYIGTHRNGSREVVYEKTGVMSEEYTTDGHVHVFSVPSNVEVRSRWRENSSVPVTMTVPIIATSAKSMVGIAGMEIDYSKLAERVMAHTSTCTNAGCLTCASPDVQCYLLDYNGFIIFSEQKSEVGRAFDRVNCAVLQKLVNENIYKRMTNYDFQAICIRKQQTGSSAMRLLNPFFAILKFSSWLLTELLLMVTDLSFGIFQEIRSYAQVGYQGPTDDLYMGISISSSNPLSPQECEEVERKKTHHLEDMKDWFSSIDVKIEEVMNNLQKLTDEKKIEAIKRMLIQQVCQQNLSHNFQHEGCKYLCKQLRVLLASTSIYSTLQVCLEQQVVRSQVCMLRWDTVRFVWDNNKRIDDDRTRTSIPMSCKDMGYCVKGCPPEETKNIYVRPVAQSNLVFLAVAGSPNCNCRGCSDIITRTELTPRQPDDNTTVPEAFRNIPPWKIKDPTFPENSKKCSKPASTFLPSVTLLLVSSWLAVTFTVRHNLLLNKVL